MKKLLHTIFSIMIFTVCSLNVKAEQFDYNNCTNGCRNAGSQYNVCMAGCDARNFIEEKKLGCSGNSLCINKWEDSFTSKRDFYMQCYETTANSEYNYCKFEYNQCYNSCPTYGDNRDCKADCNARNNVKTCILNAKNTSEVNECKDKYNDYLQDELKEDLNSTSTSQFDYNTCKSKCTDSNRKECESDCYALNKIEECKKTCPQGGCEYECEKAYESHYQYWLKTYNPYSKVQCGDMEIPYLVPQIVRTIIVFLQIATPIIIVILGSLDLVKAVIAQKEDEIKKGQQTFIRRLIIGVLVFLVFAIVQFVIGLVASNNDELNVDDMWDCVDCFVNGDCKLD